MLNFIYDYWLAYLNRRLVRRSFREVSGYHIKEVLSSLTPRESKVLKLRFGIDMKGGNAKDTDGYSLEEVGKQFDVTRERIRQIEAKALRKLRHPTRSERLKSFLENKD